MSNAIMVALVCLKTVAVWAIGVWGTIALLDRGEGCFAAALLFFTLLMGSVQLKTSDDEKESDDAED